MRSGEPTNRCFPDMRSAHDQWSTGDAIAAGVLFVVALIGVIGMIALLAHTVG